MESNNAQAIRVVAHLRFDDDHELPASRAYIDGVLGRGGLRSEDATAGTIGALAAAARRRDVLWAVAAVPCDAWVAARRRRVGDEPVDATAAVARSRAAWHRAVLETLPPDRVTLRDPADDEAFLDLVAGAAGLALGGRAPRGRTLRAANDNPAGVRSHVLAAVTLGLDATAADRTAHGAACLLLPTAADRAFAARALGGTAALNAKRWVERATGDTVRPADWRARIDVVVPTVRLDAVAVARVAALAAPACLPGLTLLVVVDEPAEQSRAGDRAERLRAALAAARAARGGGGLYVRVLSTAGRARPARRPCESAAARHRGTAGAAAARNVGLEASRAEWCVLLDDDVEPAPDLLYRYADAAHAAGGDAACFGLAGLTVFRDAGDRFSRAARSLGMVVNFDNAATWADDPGGPPWAPTANLMVRRVWPGGNDDDVEAPLAAVAARFDERCPRNGGAEDVELAARARAAGLRLRAAPGAVAAHDLWPWRGQPARACRWGRATALLAVAHPRHVRRRLPNAVEWTAGALAYGLARAPRRAPAYALAVLLGRFSALAVRQHHNAVENERLNSHLPLAERVEMGGGVGCAGAWDRFVVHGLLRAILVLASDCGDFAGAAALVPTFVASGFDGRYLFFGRAFDYTLGARAQKPRGRADVVTDVASVAGMLAFIVLLGEWVL